MAISCKAVFFDLDGTLTNSSPGIFRCAIEALERMGYPVPKPEVLRTFIGPPLWQSFTGKCGMSPEEADTAIGYYLEEYDKTGLFEAEVFEGIEDLLRDLKADGKYLALVTSKPDETAARVLRHFGLDRYFSTIAARRVEEKSSRKAGLIQWAAEAAGVRPDEAVMVGDTQYDARGAREAGSRFIGVLYGFGTREEMQAEGAECFAKDAKELAALLIDKPWQKV